jgi:hypothetical protein
MSQLSVGNFNGGQLWGHCIFAAVETAIMKGKFLLLLILLAGSMALSSCRRQKQSCAAYDHHPAEKVK